MTRVQAVEGVGLANYLPTFVWAAGNQMLNISSCSKSEQSKASPMANISIVPPGFCRRAAHKPVDARPAWDLAQVAWQVIAAFNHELYKMSHRVA
jgi:hypothetical protein